MVLSCASCWEYSCTPVEWNQCHQGNPPLSMWNNLKTLIHCCCVASVHSGASHWQYSGAAMDVTSQTLPLQNQQSESLRPKFLKLDCNLNVLVFQLSRCFFFFLQAFTFHLVPISCVVYCWTLLSGCWNLWSLQEQQLWADALVWIPPVCVSLNRVRIQMSPWLDPSH